MNMTLKIFENGQNSVTASHKNALKVSSSLKVMPSMAADWVHNHPGVSGKQY